MNLAAKVVHNAANYAETFLHDGAQMQLRRYTQTDNLISWPVDMIGGSGSLWLSHIEEYLLRPRRRYPFWAVLKILIYFLRILVS